ncbi:MAG: formamidopyrimidine-DNA glycosylase [Candidatus Saganbacteria bacterium]|uniref:Formamidopyrimidine-DNA glycosylase n=1 Tax=Candidatus Saganbacteria bacterium TaxID=2575572 RepID=A0A833L3P5_UNCSA|nr:MAG: formamidopyrimidine-DNA glycosylase [Candidatus Saganbacteria bacterium]
MPELPEVETIRKGLLPLVKRKTIRKVVVIDKRVIKDIAPKEFIAEITGEKIADIERRAKYLLFKFKSGKYMVVHLGMTGRLIFTKDKYVKVEFKFSGNKSFYYSDMRLFGKIRFYDSYPNLDLGYEPLSKEFTFNVLKDILNKCKGIIKSVLLDQKLVAGLGNIYVLESLFYAGINPQRRANSLKDNEIKKLYFEIKNVLKKALNSRGTSFSSYVDAKGKKGSFQQKLSVYGKKDLPCPKCKTPIKRINAGNRGTYFCPNCQK